MYGFAKLEIARVIIKKLGNHVKLDQVYNDIELSQKPELGQYVLKVFRLAKILQFSIQEISANTVKCLSCDPIVKAAEPIGPYVNIKLDPSALVLLLMKNLTMDKTVSPIVPDKKYSFLVEHSQPNTHKDLHIGHARNSVLGDTLCRLLRHAGHHVYVENYHGDEGVHVAKCLWYMNKHKLWPIETEDKGAWLGKIYVESTAFLATANEQNAEIMKQEISNVLKDIENKYGYFYDLWLKTRQWSLELFEKFYNWLGVNFDAQRCESDVSAESFKLVDEYLKKGLFIESHGTIGIDLSNKSLGFCMLRKSDARGLYATKDLALAHMRFRNKNPDICVYVVDNRRTYHFKQIFATLSLMGFKEASRCFHLAYEMVETKEGAMSSRTGNIVPILDLRMEIQDCAYNILKRRYEHTWNSDMIRQTANNIALAAIRYGMIKVDPESKITFNMDDWLNLTGNTGPYLQYTYARIHSLLERNKKSVPTEYLDSNYSELVRLSEEQLLSHLAGFNEAVDIAHQKLKPNYFANYVYELSKKFNSFYADSPIAQEPNYAIMSARLGLVKISAYYLATALNILGIPIIQKI